MQDLQLSFRALSYMSLQLLCMTSRWFPSSGTQFLNLFSCSIWQTSMKLELTKTDKIWKKALINKETRNKLVNLPKQTKRVNLK